ncbi:MAG: FkbM family methyltransferase [Gemmatimonadota bacterium]|nr:FkbM family methyltransferase [Gemmatimonadota bacterium]
MGRAYTYLKHHAVSNLPAFILEPLSRWHYRRVLASLADSEEQDLKVVRELVEPGMTVVDLGANIGVYTKVLSSLVGLSGTVISVEPIPQTFRVLSQNVRSFGMTNVSCVNAAVSDCEREVMMEVPNYATGGSNFYQAAIVPTSNQVPVGGRRQVRVRAITLDSLVGGGGEVSFVKCDVEGHELACLSGAEMILESQRSAWLVEVSGDPDEPGRSAEQLFRLLEARSYVAWWFDGLRLIERQPGDHSINYFFLTNAHLAKLRKKAPQFFEHV